LKIAIVHDWLTNLGGGERVVETLHRGYPDAPIYTSVYNAKSLNMLKDATIKTSYLQRWPLSKRKHQFYPVLRTLAFEGFDFSDYDVVISSSSAESKGVITNTETLHIAYIHTPTRYYWSGYNDYLKDPGFGLLDPLAKKMLPLFVGKMRNWDYAAAQRPDVMVANSQTVSDRIKKYYNRDSHVVYPPVDTQRFKNKKAIEGDYYLVVSRLIPYKKVDLAVKACTQLNKKLIVVGDGSEKASLKSTAGPQVQFISDADDAKVTGLYLNCKAFIFTAYEDFGITAVEAMAAGKPVIAFGKGGASESVLDNKTGLFFDEQSVQSLAEAINKFESLQFDAQEIIDRAEEFSEAVFLDRVRAIIENNKR